MVSLIIFVRQHFSRHFAFFLAGFNREAKKRSLWVQWFLHGKKRCVAPRCLLICFFNLSPLTADNSRTSVIFFPRAFLSDCYWSSLIGADIGLFSGEHADIHGHSRRFITMSSSVSSICVPTVKNQELHGKDNSAAYLSHVVRSAHKSTTALSKSLLWYLPTNAIIIQRLKKTKFYYFHKYRNFLHVLQLQWLISW